MSSGKVGAEVVRVVETGVSSGKSEVEVAEVSEAGTLSGGAEEVVAQPCVSTEVIVVI